jgi:hypothetical protein
MANEELKVNLEKVVQDLQVTQVSQDLKVYKEHLEETEKMVQAFLADRE